MNKHLSFTHNAIKCLGFLLFGVTAISTSQADEASSGATLTLQQAIDYAVANDDWLIRSQNMHRSQEAESLVAGTLPDPTVSLTMANLPSDSFDFSQENMTQLKVGVSQMFPRGDSLALKQQQIKQSSEQHPYMWKNRKAQVKLNVAENWLKGYQAEKSIELIELDRALFEQLVDVAESSYSTFSGRTRQQDVVRAQLELTRLNDRLHVLTQQSERFKKRLAEWLPYELVIKPIGFLPEEKESSEFAEGRYIKGSYMEGRDIEGSYVEGSYVEGKYDEQALIAMLSRHPAVLVIEKQIEASSTGIQLAEQSYKPQWGINASYGYRDDDPAGGDRSDLFSVGVTFDLPLFTEKRQDNQVRSATYRTESIKTDKIIQLRKMKGVYLGTASQLKLLDERKALYEKALLPQMHEQAEAVLNAYTTNTGDFAEVMRARIAELNTKLDALKIDVERRILLARLDYYHAGNRAQVHKIHDINNSDSYKHLHE